MAAASTLILRVIMQDDPKVMRELEVPGDKKLVDLARAIVSAFDFDFDYAFGFYSAVEGHVTRSQPKYELFADMGERTDSKSVKRTRIDAAFPVVGHKMLFLFDYGDDWRFVVEVTALGEKDPKGRYPKVLKSVGAAPEQYDYGDAEDVDDRILGATGTEPITGQPAILAAWSSSHSRSRCA
jgi:hypothetical protein